MSGGFRGLSNLATLTLMGPTQLSEWGFVQSGLGALQQLRHLKIDHIPLEFNDDILDYLPKLKKLNTRVLNPPWSESGIPSSSSLLSYIVVHELSQSQSLERLEIVATTEFSLDATLKNLLAFDLSRLHILSLDFTLDKREIAQELLSRTK